MSRNREKTRKVAGLLLLFPAIAGFPGCSREADPSLEAQAPSQAGSKPGGDAARITAAIRRAMDWSATLDVHPLRLRAERNMKGIKHFVEYLDLLHLAYRWPDDPGLSELARARALEALRITGEDAYHNLAAVDPQRFKEDSMSYLRACWLARELGADTTRYRREIEKVLPALHRALPTRGVDQRMGFALLFRDLGFPRPETEEQVYPESLIAKHAPLSYYLASGDRPYDITHEIFAMTARGSLRFPFPNPADERYARETVKSLLRHFMGQGNIDLAAELLVNLAQLGEAETAQGQEAREYIFRGQNADGSFGSYDPESAKFLKGNPRYDVRIGAYLHTTMVCVWALVESRKK